MSVPVLLRLARRYVSRRFLQSVFVVLGVALGVAVVIAIDLANGSASRAFALSTRSVAGAATHVISGGPGGLPSAVYRAVRVDLGISDSAPVIDTYVRAAELGDAPLRLLGVDPFAEPPFRDYLAEIEIIGEGDDEFAALSAFIAEPRTVLISQTLANRFGVAPGDTLTLRPGEARVTVRVVGVLQPADRVSEQALDDLILTDIATAQEIAGQPGMLTRVDLILPDGYDLRAIEALLPPGARVASVTESNTTLEQMTAAFELNLQALSLLALVVGVFLIYNTVTFSVVQRRHMIGVLRSIGMTRRQIFAMILGEALLLGLVGIIAGLGLGVIFGRAAVGIVAQTISDLYFTVNVQGVSLDVFTLVKGAGIGLLATAAAAVVPSLDATRTVPAGVLRRSEEEQSARRLLPLLTGAALVLNLFGVLLLQLPTQNIVVAFTALFAIVVGSALFTPLALLLAMRLFTPLTAALFGVVGRMAPRAVVRSLSRTSIAVAALTVAVSVIVGVSVMISSFRSTVGDWLSTTLGADIYVSPPLLTATRATVNVDPDVQRRIAATTGVTEVSASRQVSVTAPDFPDLPPVNLTAVDSDISRGARRFVWNIAPDGDYQTALAAGQIVVSEPLAFRRGITPQNNRLTLLTDSGAQTFEIVGVFYDYTTDQGIVLMSMATYRRWWDDRFISSAAAFVAPGVDVNTVLADLRTGALAGTDLLAQSNRDLRAGVFDVFDQAFAITVALRLLATLVAFIGILSALLALQLEQTRQYGMMRAVGMTAAQVWRYTLVQTGLMGLVAGALALPIGLALAVVLIEVINVRSFGWSMQMALLPGELAQAFAVALAAALLAGIYPAWRLGRLAVASAVRGE